MRAGWLVAVALAAGCAKKAEQAPPPAAKVPAFTVAEVQRSQEACKLYVDAVCACVPKVASLKDQCELAKSLPEAVRLGVEIAANTESTPADVAGAQASVRKAVKQCIEQAAKLPTLGCN